jgi:ribosomal-protein-alanine N-acetyltransferase
MIRAVEPAGADLERLAVLHAEAFAAPWTAADFAGLLGTPGTTALAAGDLDGFVLLRVAADEAEILTIAVRPAARRRGVGRALVAAAVDAAVRQAALGLWLEVAADNEAALALYAAAGFEVAGRRRAYYKRADGTRMDAVMMRRTLNTAAGSEYSP